MWLFIDYPVPTFSKHNDPGFGAILMHHIPDARIMHIDRVNLDAQMKKFINQKIRFAAEQNLNCLWIEIHLQSRQEDEGLVYRIQSILGKRYKPLAKTEVKQHC